MKRTILFILASLTGFIMQAQLETTKLVITEGITNQAIKENIENNASLLLTTFNTAVMNGKKPKIDKEWCTDGAVKSIEDLWKNSTIACPISIIKEKVTNLPSGGYQIRNIAVTVLSAPKDKQEQEIAINFDKDGKIDYVNFALEQNRYVDIIGANISLKDFARRQIIVDFVENFRTAYNRKDIEYIESVFSDNALIITGKVIKIKKGDNPYLNSLGNERIEYMTQTKAQYIAGLKRCFKRNKYIDVEFDDIEVLRHPADPTIYGVSLKQNWGSSTYNDTGFLFLLIDFKDDTKPCIQVRTWQPERYNNKVLDRNERFSLNSFNIR